MQRYDILKGKLRHRKIYAEVIEKVENVSPDTFTTAIGCIEKTYTKQPNGTYSIKERLNLDPIDISDI